MHKLITNLWFDGQAEEAAAFYTSVFKHSSLGDTTYYATETPSDKPVGSVMMVAFELNNQPFLALNGGPIFTFSESVSFIVQCDDQAEIDYYWDKLSAVPESERCGWLKDKFGVSWQIVPANLGLYMDKLDKAAAVMQAVLGMKKFDLAALERVYNAA